MTSCLRGQGRAAKLLASVTVVGLLIACSYGDKPTKAPATDVQQPTSAAEPEWFTDVAADVGLDFVHYNGASGHFYYPEILGPGVALFDYDNDGDLDVYIVQGRSLGPGEAPAPPAKALPLRGRLYRNDLRVNADGTRTLHFTDVTEQSGIRATGYGLGVAVGDIDNDGLARPLPDEFRRQSDASQQR